MKKIIFIFLVLMIAIGTITAQSDDDLFGSDDDFFGDDDFLIEEVADVSAKTDLSKGMLFDNGSVKIGGSLSASASFSTTVYQKDNTDFAENLKATTLSPSLGSSITIDARPNQDLRLFSRFNFGYPFVTRAASTAISTATTTARKISEDKTIYNTNVTTNVETKITDWIQLKEMFTDFNTGDYVSFRFGVHTVTWGAGLFYSPVSDMINTSSIDPEHRDEQVDGSLNLRTLINIPGTMNNLWFYVIPDQGTWQARDTALAVKGEFLFGGWELGAGAFYKYNTAPRAMLTASGSIQKWGLFGEAVYQYGSDREWIEKQSFDDKKSVFKATAGFMRSWSDPNITLLAQYYYDGNDFDASEYTDIMFYFQNMQLISEYGTQGHNLAVSVGFSKFFGCDDLSFSLLGITNFTKPKVIDLTTSKNKFILSMLDADTQNAVVEGINSVKNSPRTILSATLNYSFNQNASMGFGPYVTLSSWKKPPVVAVKLNFSLGGGKF